LAADSPDETARDETLFRQLLSGMPVSREEMVTSLSAVWYDAPNGDAVRTLEETMRSNTKSPLKRMRFSGLLQLIVL